MAFANIACSRGRLWTSTGLTITHNAGNVCLINSVLRYILRTIAVSNQKGGSGKTTTAVNLSAALGEQGYRVLLVDLDPQASASAWLGFRDSDRGLLEVFTDNVHLGCITHHTRIPNVDIVPVSPWLVGVDKALAAEVGAETLLRTAFASLPARWDYVVVDCPPSFGLLAIAAFVACQSLLIPVETRVMALGGLTALLRTRSIVRSRAVSPPSAMTRVSTGMSRD